MTKRLDVFWCLKTPGGHLLDETTGYNLDECWGKAFNVVSHLEGEKWARKYWKNWDKSIRAANKLGYKFVRVKLVEVINGR